MGKRKAWARFNIYSEAVLEWEGKRSSHLLLRLVGKVLCLVWCPLDHPCLSRLMQIKLRAVISTAFPKSRAGEWHLSQCPCPCGVRAVLPVAVTAGSSLWPPTGTAGCRDLCLGYFTASEPTASLSACLPTLPQHHGCSWPSTHPKSQETHALSTPPGACGSLIPVAEGDEPHCGGFLHNSVEEEEAAQRVCSCRMSPCAQDELPGAIRCWLLDRYSIYLLCCCQHTELPTAVTLGSIYSALSCWAPGRSSWGDEKRFPPGTRGPIKSCLVLSPSGPFALL